MEAPVQKPIEVQTVISLTHRGSHDEIPQVYHELYEWGRQHNVVVTGRGFTIFMSPPEEFDPQSSLFEVCLPVEGEPTGDDRVAVKTIPACTVASVTVEGPYEDIPAHYTEMLAWLSVEGMEVAGPPREVYIKRPDAAGRTEPNTFETEIQFPVKQ